MDKYFNFESILLFPQFNFVVVKRAMENPAFGKRRGRYFQTGRGSRSQGDHGYSRSSSANQNGRRVNNNYRGRGGRGRGARYGAANRTQSCLLKWSQEPSENLIWSINQDGQNPLKEIINSNISIEQMQLLMDILSRAVSNKSCQIIVTDLLDSVFSTNFLNKLTQFVKMNGTTKVDDKFFGDLLDVISSFLTNSPSAIDRISSLIKAVIAITQNLTITKPDLAALTNQFQRFLYSQEEDSVDFIAPHRINNFREISIEPSAEDLNYPITKFQIYSIPLGEYEDVDTYLDTQFKLLREDYLRPLRNGFHKYLNKILGRNFDVTAYKNVRFLSASISRDTLVYKVKLDLPKKNKLVESTKKFMNDNLVFLSDDNFMSCFLATIGERNENLLNNGIIQIVLLSNEKINYKKSYTLVDPSNFFVPYKFVLRALQKLNKENFPLFEHIVFVDEDSALPLYLQDTQNTLKQKYDLRVILDSSLMKQSKCGSIFEQFEQSESEEAKNTPASYRLSSVNVTDDISLWPSKEEFKLDKSQLSALHAALTSRMTIIQGPPGTGKTFIGLKIVQILLHNSEAWLTPVIKHPYTKLFKSTDGHTQPPILVVCFTNHALDQFLEGMQKFTNKIVRIGGSCKSEKLKVCQIFEIMEKIKEKKKFPWQFGSASYNLFKEAKEVELKFKRHQNRLIDVVSKSGLIKWNTFLNYKVIPKEIQRELTRSTYRDWIMPDDNEIQQCETIYQNENIWYNRAPDDSFQDNIVEWFDALQISEEACSSQIVDEFLHVDASDVDFEIKESEISFELENICHSSGVAFAIKKLELEMTSNCLKRIPFYIPRDVMYLQLKSISDLFKLEILDRLLLYASWKIKLEEHYHRMIRKLEASLYEMNLKCDSSQVPTVISVESDLFGYQSRMKGLITIKGIIKWQSFRDAGVIPKFLCNQLRSSSDYMQWLSPKKQKTSRSTHSSLMWKDWDQNPSSNLGMSWKDDMEVYRQFLASPCEEFDESKILEVHASEEVFEVTPQNYTMRLIEIEQRKEDWDDQEEYTNITKELKNMRSKLRRVTDTSKEDMDILTLNEDVDIRCLSFSNRIVLYSMWRRLLILALHQKITQCGDELKKLSAKKEAIKLSKYLFVCRQAEVVGMTTTGAAKWQTMLQDLKPKIGKLLN